MTEASGVPTARRRVDGDRHAECDRCRQLGGVQPAEQSLCTSYGHFTVDASGNWSYTLDDSNGAVQALNTGGTLHDLITVTTADGTSHQIDVTINGANDAAVITGVDTGAVTEASGVLNGTPGVSTATGSLSATDVDSSAAFNLQSNAVTSYGHFTVDASGNWSYTLDDSNGAVQALNTGGTLHDLITVTTADGTSPARSTSRSTAPTTRR